VKEIAMMISESDLQLTEGSNIKFLHVIDPTENTVVNIKGTFSRESSGVLLINASIMHDNTVFFKFKGRFTHP